MRENRYLIISVIVILLLGLVAEFAHSKMDFQIPPIKVQADIKSESQQNPGDHTQIIAVNLQYINILIICISIFFTGLSVTIVYLSYKKEKEAENNYKEFKRDTEKLIKEGIPIAVVNEAQNQIDILTQKALSKSADEVTNYCANIGFELKKDEMHKNYAINQMMQSLFSVWENCLLAIVPQASNCVPSGKDIRISVTKHFLDMNNLIYLFSPEKNVADSGIMYFIENPNSAINKDIIDIIIRQHKHNLDIKNRVRQLEDKLAAFK